MPDLESGALPLKLMTYCFKILFLAVVHTLSPTYPPIANQVFVATPATGMRPSCPVLWLSCQGAMSLYKQPQEKELGRGGGIRTLDHGVKFQCLNHLATPQLIDAPNRI